MNEFIYINNIDDMKKCFHAFVCERIICIGF